jgi:hypothetical protein
MDAEARAKARRTAHATKGRGYGLFLLAAVGASLCFALAHNSPAALAVGTLLVLVSTTVAIRIEGRLRSMDPAKRSRLVSAAGFTGLVVALVFPFVLPPEWAILLAAPGVGGLIGLGLIRLRQGKAALAALAALPAEAPTE